MFKWFLNIINIFGCKHNWNNWSDLELIGYQYELISGDVYYSQRKICNKCNKTIISNQTIQGNGKEARLAEIRKGKIISESSLLILR